ncbi:MAG: cytidine deaminase [Prevotellaceae bacterium]|jgi:cytidine deaminase|nr:cytidine deaminase [Prevotellaceae bacterium]
MKVKEVKIEVAEYASVAELGAEDAMLVQRAKEMANNAYAPYSKFQVGAAVLLANGEVVTGANQENAAYPSGLCAERTALFYAGAKYPDVAVKTIAIAAQTDHKYCDQAVYPCGSCRQVMLETEKRGQQPIKVIMVGERAIEVVKDAASLLPLHFDLDAEGNV